MVGLVYLLGMKWSSILLLILASGCDSGPNETEFQEAQRLCEERSSAFQVCRYRAYTDGPREGAGYPVRWRCECVQS